MTFALYALLGEQAPAFTNESLASDLEDLFRHEEDFSIKFELLPFAKNETLALWWGAWLVRVCYEEGTNVAQDSARINKIVGSTAPYDLSDIARRIRVVFGSDNTREYENHIIGMMDFLRVIPGVVIFDPQQRNLMKLARAQDVFGTVRCCRESRSQRRGRSSSRTFAFHSGIRGLCDCCGCTDGDSGRDPG